MINEKATSEERYMRAALADGSLISVGATAIRPLLEEIDRLRAALSDHIPATGQMVPGSTGSAEGWHGPFGYMVCPAGLDESHWWISDDPVKDEGSFCLPMFTKEDPFERAMIDAAGGRDEG